jgi:acyl transferase domain-containing protein/acyl carrier protein
MSKDIANSIAVIGMSCRFPGAENLSQYWENLRDGVESISFFTDDELVSSGVDKSVFDTPNYIKAGSILEDIDLFDASFFGINPREAESMDPQQRLFMESAWHALEDAGYDPDRFPGSIGVYGGCASSTYLRELERNPALVELLGHIQVLIGNEKDYLTTHTSYKLNLRGPSFSVQTACSTSLVAISLACQALLNEQCDMALAGGVCVRVPQKAGYVSEAGGIFSPDGHCRVFDSRAAGIVFGNGVGIVVLKQLKDALTARDPIYAVVRGSAVNNDGCFKASYTAPGLDGQADVITKAHAIAGVRPETITYVETHGTGTSIGDPIEVAALTKAFRRGTAKKNFCAIGSVKTNIGHLDPAAGVASFIKTVLALENKQIPPSLHFETPNPNIDFEQSPFYVNTRLSEWASGQEPRRAGVSAFGIGGTNVHVVLEEAPSQPGAPATRPDHLLVMSAKTPFALEVASSTLLHYLQEKPDLNARDLAYTYQAGRRVFPYRRAFAYRNIDHAINLLATLPVEHVFTGTQSPKQRPVVFMFPGQGAQYVNMSSDLYHLEPTFRRQVDLCADCLKPHLGIDLRSVVFAPPQRVDEAGQELLQTRFAQPALFVIDYSLAKLWQEWGVQPQAMIGHSIGEYVAAALSGVLSLEDALMLVAARGRLMQALPSGCMLAAALSEAEVTPWLDGDLSLAAVNDRSTCVVSGTHQAVERFERHLASRGTEYTRLRTSHAFHSQMMEPILDQFTELVKKLRLGAPSIPYISNVTGSWITSADAMDPSYWTRHLRQCVRFANGLDGLMATPGTVFLEVGPGYTLSTYARHHPARAGDQLIFSSLRHQYGRQADNEFVLNTLARLWTAGIEIDWEGFHAHERCGRIHLPVYPFERQRYWAEAPGKVGGVGTLKDPNVGAWFYVPSWEYTLLSETKPDQAALPKHCWLIFIDASGFGSHIAAKLKASGHDVTTVSMGRGFSGTESEYRINPRKQQDYTTLLDALRASRKRPRRIVHLWTVARPPASDSEMQGFVRWRDRGFSSVAFLAQALIAQNVTYPVQITVLSSGMCNVNGREEISPAKSALLAVCKAIPQEYPNLVCRAIDLDLPASGPGANDALLELLIDDLTSDSPDPVVAYRGDQRWNQVFERQYLEPAEDVPALLRDSGVYLITGGLGSIGLEIANELARTVRARLVLLGRSVFPRRNHWNKWLQTHARDDATSRRIRKIQDIESFGASVMVASADVADEVHMRRVVRRIYAQFGELNGVIHAAGDLSPDAFFAVDQVSPERCERQFRAKVRGLITLAKILDRRDLDFWLLISSISSILAGLGYSAYSAANIFLDSFAAQKNLTSSARWMSINWDTWNFEKPARKNAAPKPTELSMNPLEGIDALWRILFWGSTPQIVVSTGDLHSRLEQWVNRAFTTASQRRDARLRQHIRPELPLRYIAPRNPMEQAIANVVQETLGVLNVGVLDNFFTDLSGTSLMASHLVARLRSEFEAELPLRKFFEGPTVAELAVAIEAAVRSNASAPVELPAPNAAVFSS